MQVRAERVGVHSHGDDAGCGAPLARRRQDDAARRIHDAVGVDAIHFERCDPTAGLTPRRRARNGPRGGRARRGLRCCGE
jgi:hypothetical protein